jgi:hypothetical protein
MNLNIYGLIFYPRRKSNVCLWLRSRPAQRHFGFMVLISVTVFTKITHRNPSFDRETSASVKLSAYLLYSGGTHLGPIV